ncbi:MAG: cytochrome-c peroxidase [Phycisphaerales bacterium]|nr:cytochrome-c peroxidase [Phycisphaerales bacterium]
MNRTNASVQRRTPTSRTAVFVAVASLGFTANAILAQTTDPGDAIDVLERLAEAIDTPTPLPRPATDDDFYPRDEAKETLGRLLFFDKILSGNRNISCATCHHSLTDTGDGLSLPVGEGARGLGVTRNLGVGKEAVHERVPRNAPHLFNLGALEFERMFDDGRLEVNPFHPSGFSSPAGDDLPPGLDNVLAAQAMFPVTSATEMAGQAGENSIADAVAHGDLAGPNGVWSQLAGRLRQVGEYRRHFIAAFEDIEAAGDITYVHAANAIAAFEAAAFRADDSPFDRFLRGDRKALSRRERNGLRLFYGSAGCSSCHSGTFQTNHEFAAVAMPQIGPGKGDNQRGYDDGHDDFGRERVTLDRQDRFRFRVPSLRNIALTGPWGHAGSYNTLEGVVRQLLDPVVALQNYDTSQAVLPSRSDLDAVDFSVQGDARRVGGIARACELEPIALSEEEIAELVDFLHALTDPSSLDLRWTTPMEVPSGLPVFD